MSHIRVMLPHEACKHVCPLMFNESGEGITCQADRCMAWQWYDQDWIAVSTPGASKPNPKIHGLGWRHINQIDGNHIWSRPNCDNNRRGYCGHFTQDRWSPKPRPKAIPLSECVHVDSA